jgi:hypothetical protein
MTPVAFFFQVSRKFIPDNAASPITGWVIGKIVLPEGLRTRMSPPGRETSRSSRLTLLTLTAEPAVVGEVEVVEVRAKHRRSGGFDVLQEVVVAIANVPMRLDHRSDAGNRNDVRFFVARICG